MLTLDNYGWKSYKIIYDTSMEKGDVIMDKILDRQGTTLDILVVVILVDYHQ